MGDDLFTYRDRFDPCPVEDCDGALVGYGPRPSCDVCGWRQERTEVIDGELARAKAELATAGHWSRRANCLGLDPETFLPQRAANDPIALSVCSACEVATECDPPHRPDPLLVQLLEVRRG